MYLTPRQKRKNLITILILTLGIPLTVFAAWQAVQIISKAGVEPVPTDIVVSNISTSSVAVGWVTQESVNGAVVIIENGQDSSQIVDKRGNDKRKTHYVELTDLEPNSQYTYAIVSGGERYTEDDKGHSFTFVTSPVSSSVPTPNPVYGSGGNFDEDDFTVYIINKSQSSYPVSVVPNTSGGWAADLSGFRSTDNMSLITVDDSDSLELIAISGIDIGDIIEGTYSELFDSAGELRSIYSLSPEENSDLMSSFENFTMAVVVEEEEDDSSVSTTIVEEEEENEGERVFRIVHDLEWVDMVEAGGNIDIETGEDSVLITNKRDTGFDVIWVSEEEEEGYIAYGEEEDDLSLEAKDIRDSLTVKSEYRVHYIEIEDLDSETEYFFSIYSGNDVYDGYSVTTFETLSSPPPISSISGGIEDLPSEGDAIVVGRIVDKDEEGTSGDSVYISTIADSSGGWILSIADARNADGSSYYSYTDEDVIQLFAVCLGESTVSEESMGDIEDRDLSIEVTGDLDTIAYTRIPLLSNYGVQ